MQKRAVPESGPYTEELCAALALPSGAKFYRCALQVNPFDYQGRHGKSTKFTSEDEYNEAMIAACHDANIEVIAVTDHYRIKSSEKLLLAARSNGIHAFPAFEAATKDGVHFLCIFDEERNIKELDRIIGDCGILDDETDSPRGKYDTVEFLKKTKEWKAQCVAAHVTGDSGLLKVLNGQGRMDAWKHDELLACAIPGSPADVPGQFKEFICNKNKLYQRDRLPALINASDVNAPEDLEKKGASCFIKMSNPSVEGLRQAFLDPDSRVRLLSDTVDSRHAKLEAITWQGGFLNGAAIRFNSNLNAVIGGRGVGKSTVVESIRYAFDLAAIGKDAQRNHDDVVLKVLQPGTKVSVLIRTDYPNSKYYIVERTVPSPPVVRDGNGSEIAVSPIDVVPQIAVFGQHEIAEMAKRPDGLVNMLRKFCGEQSQTSSRKFELQRDLQITRNRIVETKRELAQISEDLEALPGLEESLSRIQKSGVGEHLEGKSLLNRESRILTRVDERMGEYQQLLDSAKELQPADLTFLSESALKELPNADIIDICNHVFTEVDQRLQEFTRNLEETLVNAGKKIESIKEAWGSQREMAEESYMKTLRSLQQDNIDGTKYVGIRNRIEALIPLKDREESLNSTLSDYNKLRSDLYNQLEMLRISEYQHLEQIAKSVTKSLKGHLRISAHRLGKNTVLEEHLKKVGGNIDATIQRLLDSDDLSLQELSQCCIEGEQALVDRFNIPQRGAARLASADLDWKMQVEELDSPLGADLELNIAVGGKAAVWRKLSELSKGQQATAILLLLLGDTEAPLIVDQPEDDLDNRFVSESVVPMMRDGKMKRQYIFTTHNANIPILGDAEQIIGLDVRHEECGIRAIVDEKMLGSIDKKSVKDLAEEVLEGGKEAFETRRDKYGF